MMSDWQKVRVSFADADGKDVSVLLWANDYVLFMGAQRGDVNAWCLTPGKGLKVEPIRELPTGVGAVIRVSSYGDGESSRGDDFDVWVRSMDDLWANRDGDWDKPGDDWQFEVLSEGIVL